MGLVSSDYSSKLFNWIILPLVFYYSLPSGHRLRSLEALTNWIWGNWGCPWTQFEFDLNDTVGQTAELQPQRTSSRCPLSTNPEPCLQFPGETTRYTSHPLSCNGVSWMRSLPLKWSKLIVLSIAIAAFWSSSPAWRSVFSPQLKNTRRKPCSYYSGWRLLSLSGLPANSLEGIINFYWKSRIITNWFTLPLLTLADYGLPVADHAIKDL